MNGLSMLVWQVLVTEEIWNNVFYQSNHEGDIMDIIHNSKDKYDGE